MAKGQIAKETLGSIIIEAVGDKFVTVQDKKIYVNMDDGGETVQVAIAMTVPKTPIAAGSSTSSSSKENSAFTSTELSPEDKAKVEQLKKLLNVE
jgi:hypothetical protein